MTQTQLFPSLDILAPTPEPRQHSAKLWLPKRVVFTPDALDQPFGQQMLERVTAQGLEVELLKSNRLTSVRGEDARDTYRRAKSTLAVVCAPPSALRLQPTPPSADWQMNLAEGCPAHCQYCYLAGSLTGPPVVKAFANLPQLLENTQAYEQSGRVTSFEVSCYTDVLGIEHLTGSLAECIRYFGQREGAHLRFVSKYDHVDSLLGLPHHGRTRARFSLNAEAAVRKLEGGTASVEARLQALRKLALPVEQGGGGYPVGVVLAPIMPLPGWQDEYRHLLDRLAATLDFPCDLTAECITHRFTPGSKEVLLQWYPNTSLDLEEATRAVKRNKFGGTKFVYQPTDMRTLKEFFYQEWQQRFPNAPILYWT
ncbi:spore photoproduct lyase [Hymenobacter luteus]|uniref:Spore photoproduct lyase n=2 Tax=Hymenobacter TaxID=89966 RepID=A0A7W9WCF8_9BACT|nr:MULTISPECIES: radical SAM protein [Hymenobacter]MBB4601166.1 spore photoproduct lyase [Hymenobacter latericoloratus]MBB6058627.1 spore photoproduct lyase [Hymenobacter luteus]